MTSPARRLTSGESITELGSRQLGGAITTGAQMSNQALFNDVKITLEVYSNLEWYAPTTGRFEALLGRFKIVIIHMASQDSEFGTDPGEWLGYIITEDMDDDEVEHLGYRDGTFLDCFDLCVHAIA